MFIVPFEVRITTDFLAAHLVSLNVSTKKSLDVSMWRVKDVLKF